MHKDVDKIDEAIFMTELPSDAAIEWMMDSARQCGLEAELASRREDWDHWKALRDRAASFEQVARTARKAKS